MVSALMLMLVSVTYICTRSLVLVFDEEQEQAAIKICEASKLKEVLASTSNK